VYKPAAEVGGDFFQVIPLGEQGQEGRRTDRRRRRERQGA